MLVKIFLVGFTCWNSFLGFICHTENGTEYGEKSVAMYTESNHGPDGKLFLDPYFENEINHLNQEKILDAGCGAAPWSIYAAKHGGEVYALDLQEDMIRSAKKAIEASGFGEKISLIQGDVAALPFQNRFFDRVISICVGCNLPPESFEKHFLEFNRTLKLGGTVVIGAPTSLDVVFTDGSITDNEIYARIHQVLNELPDNPSAELISEVLVPLKEILSATFIVRNHRLELVKNEETLVEGGEIWRKLPKLVVPNRYYSRDSYIKELKKHGFDIQKIDSPHFSDQAENERYNSNAPPESRLGSEYVFHSPFVVFHAKKSVNRDLDYQDITVHAKLNDPKNSLRQAAFSFLKRGQRKRFSQENY